MGLGTGLMDDMDGICTLVYFGNWALDDMHMGHLLLPFVRMQQQGKFCQIPRRGTRQAECWCWLIFLTERNRKASTALRSRRRSSPIERRSLFFIILLDECVYFAVILFKIIMQCVPSIGIVPLAIQCIACSFWILLPSTWSNASSVWKESMRKKNSWSEGLIRFWCFLSGGCQGLRKKKNEVAVHGSS